MVNDMKRVDFHIFFLSGSNGCWIHFICGKTWSVALISLD